MRLLMPLTLAGLALTLASCTTPSTNAPSSSGNGGVSPGPTPRTGRIRMGMMPKGPGIPYFNACQRGAEEAAKELGDVDLVYNAPSSAQSEAQSQMIDTWRVSRFDAITVACNDPDQIAPSLAQAHDSNIFVTTYDADANAQTSRRQFFVNQATVESIAHALVDEMARQTGPEAKVAVLSSEPAAPNQSAWLRAMEAYIAEKYPKLQVIQPYEYGKEERALSYEKAETILKVYPDVKGIWGLTSMAFPAAAEAVEKNGKKSQVAVVGLGTPKDMKPFVDRGVVKTVILWNPVDLGYLAVHVTRAVARGELKPGATTFPAGRLGDKRIEGDVVILGDPLFFTKKDIHTYDF
jgi:rhamnose transport system substrate-binding protein